MPVERYFLPSSFKKDKEEKIEGKEFHHLAHVTRIRKGENIELVNGCGQCATAQVISLERNYCHVNILNIITEEPSVHSIIIAQALPRLNRLTTIVEKGTELGMTELWLFPGVRSEKKNVSEQLYQRLQQVAVGALKQCGRLYLPKICIMQPLQNWEKPEIPCFFGDPLSEPLKKIENKKLCFFIGPEGGFSDGEVNIFKSWNSQGVKLHHNILRTDTAPLVALSIIHQILL